MLTDLRSIWRALFRRRLVTAMVIGELALTIGACAAIFSVINATLLRHLPYRNDNELVVVWHTQASASGVVGMAPHDYEQYRDTSHAFSSAAAISTRGCNFTTGSEPSRMVCARASNTMLTVLEVAPAKGRWFTALEDHDGGAHVVVISDRVWRGRLGARDDVLSTTVTLDGESYQVIGVMPPAFTLPPEGLPGFQPADCWTPSAFTPTERRTPSFDQAVIARLASAVSPEQAQGDADRIAHAIWETYPPALKNRVQLRARVTALRDQIASADRTAVFVFAAAALCLLLLGCANVTNLVLAQTQARDRELRIRAALGASRWSIARLLLLETLSLALSGGILGTVVASSFLQVIVALAPGNIPGLQSAHLDVLALAFTACCTMGVGVLCGVAPALRAARPLASSARGTSTSGIGRDVVRSGLVVMELSLAVVLLASAGLLVRSFIALSNVQPGFNPSNVLTFSVELPAASYRDKSSVSAFVQAATARLRALPSVTAVAAGTSLPIGATDYTVVSRPDAPAAQAGFQAVALQVVTPAFHNVFSVRLKHGRLLSDSDGETTLPVALVNETAARQYWPDTDPVGRSVTWLAGGNRALTVVGVVTDVRQGGLESPVRPTVYIPLAQAIQPARHLAFAIHAQAEQDALAASIRRALMDVDSQLPIFALQPAAELIAGSTAKRRFSLFLVGTFAMAALILAVFGLYALIAYLVGASTREFGIRMALGATPFTIVGMIAGRGLRLVGLGLAVGVAVALGTDRLLVSLLFGIAPLDPATFAGVIVVLLASATAAITIPAVRATQIDPVTALRQE